MSGEVTDPQEIERVRRATQFALRQRDLAMLPRYDVNQVATCLRPSPIAVAEGTRKRPAAVERPTDNEFVLRVAQMDLYASQQAHGVYHTFDYDPCRSR
jgi:hypothetical protein